MQYKKVRSVTLPTLSMKDAGTLVHILFMSAFVLGRKMEQDKKAGEDEKQPAHVANIINLDTGEEMQIVGSKVLRGTLEEEYPESSYVGKCFEIENLGKHKGGKSAEGYNTFRIIEVEKPEGVAAQAASKPAAAGKPAAKKSRK